MRVFLILLLTGLATACSGPFLLFAGGALNGPEEAYTTAAVPAEDTLIELETRLEDPYSVNLNAFVIDGNLYLDPAADRTWYQHIAVDPRVRLRIGGGDVVYRALAVKVTDPAIIARFEADRIPMRIDPR